MPHIWNIVPDAEFFGFQVCSNNVPENKQGVYAIVHIDTDRPYVGTGKNIKKRVKTHSKSKGQKKLYNAIKKHGINNFVVVPIYYSTVSNTRYELEEIEGSLIQDYDAVKNGFNVLPRSNRGPYGPAFSAIIREILAKPEIKQRQSKGIREAYQRPGVRERQSEISKKRAASDPDFVERLRAGRTPEVEKRRGESIKNTWAKPEVRQRKSEKQRKRMSDPEYARRIGQAVSKAAQRPEEKQRRSEAAKKVAASDPNFVKRLHAAQTPESEARRIKSLKKTLADPAIKKRKSEVSIGKRWFTTPEGKQYTDFLPRNASDKPGRPIGQKRTLEARKNMSESAKRISANPERKKCRSITSKQMWLDPEFRKRNTGRKWFHTTEGTNYKANEPRDPSDILGRIWTPHRNPPGMRFFVMPSGTRYLSIEPRDPLDKPLKKSRTVKD